LHFTLEGERMKGEWVMFRLKPRRGEKREPWMLKKVTDEFANAEDGDELVDELRDQRDDRPDDGRDRARRATSGDRTARARKAAREEEGERGAAAVPAAAARHLVDEVPPVELALRI
jgi:bifunctional non-homologous end joining protein LigD